MIEPNLTDIALAEKKYLPKYPVSVLEATHRNYGCCGNAERLNQIQTLVKAVCGIATIRASPKALEGKFGGNTCYFELGLVQGVDLDNQRKL